MVPGEIDVPSARSRVWGGAPAENGFLALGVLGLRGWRVALQTKHRQRGFVQENFQAIPPRIEFNALHSSTSSLSDSSSLFLPTSSASESICTRAVRPSSTSSRLVSLNLSKLGVQHRDSPPSTLMISAPSEEDLVPRLMPFAIPYPFGSTLTLHRTGRSSYTLEKGTSFDVAVT